MSAFGYQAHATPAEAHPLHTIASRASQEASELDLSLQQTRQTDLGAFQSTDQLLAAPPLNQSPSQEPPEQRPSHARVPSRVRRGPSRSRSRAPSSDPPTPSRAGTLLADVRRTLSFLAPGGAAWNPLASATHWLASRADPLPIPPTRREQLEAATVFGPPVDQTLFPTGTDEQGVDDVGAVALHTLVAWLGWQAKYAEDALAAQKRRAEKAAARLQRLNAQAQQDVHAAEDARQGGGAGEDDGEGGEGGGHERTADDVLGTHRATPSTATLTLPIGGGLSTASLTPPTTNAPTANSVTASDDQADDQDKAAPSVAAYVQLYSSVRHQTVALHRGEQEDELKFSYDCAVEKGAQVRLFARHVTDSSDSLFDPVAPKWGERWQPALVSGPVLVPGRSFGGTGRLPFALDRIRTQIADALRDAPSEQRKHARSNSHTPLLDQEGDQERDQAAHSPHDTQNTPAPEEGQNAGLGLGLLTDEDVEAGAADAPEEKEEELQLAIVVDALNEKGQVLTPRNAQITYVRLTLADAPPPEGDAAERDVRSWNLHVQGQEAVIGLVRFGMHEIYGLERAEDDDEAECPICFTDPPHTVLLPCTHALCKDCALQLREASRKKNEKTANSRSNRKKKWASYTCPVCRQGMFRCALAAASCC